MTLRHALKLLLRRVPGFAGMFQRREQLREQARTIESMRMQLAEQNGAIDSLRTRAAGHDGELASAKTRAAELGGEMASLAARGLEQSGEIASLRAQAEGQGDEIASLRAQGEAQSGEITSLRAQAGALNGEIASLWAHAEAQVSVIASLRMQADAQGGEIVSLSTHAAAQGGEIASLRAHAESQGSVIASLRIQADAQGREIASLGTHAAAQGAEIALLRDQLATMRVEAEAREAGRAAPKHLRWEDVPHLEKQGLFIVGHARSGTSILLRALNTCPDIFLLGEASLFVEGLKNGFARWFNEMHRQVGQANGKGTYCPVVPDEDANGIETLHWLGQRFRYIGEKAAFRSEKLGYNPNGFFDFHARHFLSSHYVCIVRNPVDLLKSNNQMFKPEDLSVYADSYLQSLQLTLEIANTFPNVFVLFHERINQQTFDTIGEQLGVGLQDAFALYNKKLQAAGRRRTDQLDLPSLNILVEAHRQVRVVFSPRTLRKYPGSHWQELSAHMRALRQELAASATHS